MNPTYHIIVCGHSLYLEAVAKSLRMQPGLEVTRVDPHHPDAPARVAALAPNVVIVERDGQANDLTLELLHRGFPLIGLDAGQNTVTILSERRAPVDSIADLAQVIGKVIDTWDV